MEERKIEENKVIDLKPIRIFDLIYFIILIIVSIVLVIYFSINANKILGISSFSKSSYHSLIRNLLTFLPSFILFNTAVFFHLPKLIQRWRIDNKFIQEIMSVGGVTAIDSCDMHKVEDVKLVGYGVYSEIVVTTKDKSSPTIKIKKIRNTEAKAAFDFINEMAVNSVTERLNRKK